MGGYLILKTGFPYSSSTMAEPRKMAEKALQKLADQLTCPICLDNYTTPRVLPCLHVFCEDCLSRLVLRDPENLTATCPNCRRETRLPQEGVAGLPPAFYINHLFEVRDTLQKVTDPNKPCCEKCEDGDATGYCRNCGKFVCEACITVHRKWKELAEHEIATLGQIEADVAQLAPPKKVAMKCSKHPSEELKIYCESCNELICRDCTVKAHRDHQFDLVSDCFPKHRDAIVASLQPIKQQLHIVNQAVAEVDARFERTVENGDTIKLDIQAATNELITVLKAREQQLMAEVDQIVGQTSKTLAAQRDHYQLTQTQLASCVEFVEESLRTGSPQEVLSMKKPVVERVQQMAEEFQPNHFQPGSEEIIHFSHEQLTDACKRFGETKMVSICPEKCYATGEGVEGAIASKVATFTVHTVDKDGKTCEDPNVPITAELVLREGVSTVKCQVAWREDHTYHLTYQPQSHGQHDLRVKVYHRPIKNSPFAVAVRKTAPNCQGIHMKSITGLNRPHSLVVTKEKFIVVAENHAHCITVFDRDGHKLRSFGHLGFGLSTLSYPRGIALCCDNSVLVTADHCVKKYSLDGKFIASVGTEGSGQLEFKEPRGIATNNKQVYVCDAGNNRIQVLNEDLTYHSSLGSRGSGPGQFDFPVGVAFDSSGKIFVVDYMNNRIQVFNPEGQILYQFNKQGRGMENLSYPTNVFLDSDDFVYMVQHYAGCVSIFDSKGKFVKSFGKEGDKAGGVCELRGIAVDRNGYVYVSDSINNRIQVFK